MTTDLAYSLQTSMWGQGVPGTFQFGFDGLYAETHGTPSVSFSDQWGSDIYARLTASLGLDYQFGFGLIGNFQLFTGDINVDYGVAVNEIVSTAETTLNQASTINTAGYASVAAAIASSAMSATASAWSAPSMISAR